MLEQTPKPRLLITGISGFLGWHIAQMAQAQWDLYGTYHSHAVTLPQVTTLKVDLTDFTELRQLLHSLQPAALIHAAAQAKPNLCQTNPEASHAINVTASLNLAELCADAGIPLVFTSTDLVFDGRNAPYREQDETCPVSLYGEQKVLAERGILDRYPAAAVCRMPLMFGDAPTAPSFLQDFLTRLRAGQELQLFIDEFRTPVSGRDAARGLLLALEKRVQGLLHLGGKERLSRYEFGCQMVDVFQLTDAKIVPSRQAEVQMAAPRPPDVSMDSALAFSLGYNPGLVSQELIALSRHSTSPFNSSPSDGC